MACGARLTGEGPVRIGLPLDGWDLAVVDADGRAGRPRASTGELIIGGVGLARYLDPAKDAEKYAPMPTLGWDRAYRSGDLVANDAEGLVFCGRADDQVKLGGRRIELGEIDSALLALPGVTGAAAAVRTHAVGQPAAGRLRRHRRRRSTRAASVAHLRAEHARAAWCRGLAVVDTCRPAPRARSTATRCPGRRPASAREHRLARRGSAAPPPGCTSSGSTSSAPTSTSPDDDFFDLGGGSLTAAQLVSRLRERFPEVTVADIYDDPTLGALAPRPRRHGQPGRRPPNRTVPPVPVKTQIGQVALHVPLRTLAGLALAGLDRGRGEPGRYGVGPGLAADVLLVAGRSGAGSSSSARRAGSRSRPPAARLLLRGVGPGTYPRGGKVHLRLWLAERLADELGATNLAGAPCAEALRPSARRHGRPARRPALRSAGDRACSPSATAARSSPRSTSPATGSTATSCTSAASRSARDARVGARSTLLPRRGRRRRAEVAPGSAVFGEVPAGEFWSGRPAARSGDGPRAVVRRRAAEPAERGCWRTPPGRAVHLPAAARGRRSPACSRSRRGCADADVGRGRVLDARSLWLPLATVVGLLVLAAARAGRGPAAGGRARARPPPGAQPAGLAGVVDAPGARRGPHLAVPALLQHAHPGLAACAGRRRSATDVEASTVLLIPTLTTVNDGAFLADDTLLGGYELGGGWLRIERGQDRQARLRRQLRHGRTRSQGAQAGPGRGAVGRAAADQGQGRHVVAGQPARPSCGALRGDGDPTPHLRTRPRGCGSPAPWSRCAGWCR